MNNNIFTGLPVNWRGNLVLVTGLQGVDDAQDLLGIAASRSWVGEDGADGLLGIDDKDGADSESLKSHDNRDSNYVSALSLSVSICNHNVSNMEYPK